MLLIWFVEMMGLVCVVVIGVVVVWFDISVFFGGLLVGVKVYNRLFGSVVDGGWFW